MICTVICPISEMSQTPVPITERSLQKKNQNVNYIQKGGGGNPKVNIFNLVF